MSKTLPSREAAVRVAVTAIAPCGKTWTRWKNGRRSEKPGARRSGVPPPRQETRARSPGRTRTTKEAVAATTSAETPRMMAAARLPVMASGLRGAFPHSMEGQGMRVADGDRQGVGCVQDERGRAE